VPCPPPCCSLCWFWPINSSSGSVDRHVEGAPCPYGRRIEAAHKAIEKAEARAAEYAAKLRQARAEIFKAREERIKQWNTERDAALDVARKATGPV